MEKIERDFFERDHIELDDVLDSAYQPDDMPDLEDEDEIFAD
ncbi:MAG: hypothetical protein AAGA85_04755 [Bacteroidota bacterium]